LAVTVTGNFMDAAGWMWLLQVTEKCQSYGRSLYCIVSAVLPNYMQRSVSDAAI